MGDQVTNLQLQEEELSVLSSIFGDDIAIENANATNGTTTFSLTIRLAPGALKFIVHFPATYPSDAPPFYELRTLGGWKVKDELRTEMDENLMGLFTGEVVGYTVTYHSNSNIQHAPVNVKLNLSFSFFIPSFALCAFT